MYGLCAGTLLLVTCFSDYCAIQQIHHKNVDTWTKGRLLFPFIKEGMTKEQVLFIFNGEPPTGFRHGPGWICHDYSYLRHGVSFWVDDMGRVVRKEYSFPTFKDRQGIPFN